MKAWVDIDNAPHVQLFRPIISRLRELGAEVEVTSRNRTFVGDLLDAASIKHTVIGQGQPSGFGAKAAALASRTLALTRFAAGKRFDVAVGHGSRALPPAARLSGVPNLTMFDYEHVSTWLFRRFCDRILVPRAVVDGTSRPLPSGPWRAFDGFKEEIYLAGFRADPSIRERLGVAPGKIMAVIRPPARTAHYHDSRADAILDAVTARLSRESDVSMVWLRRDPGDPVPNGREISNVIVPPAPLDGPSLLAASDLVISGGGTMNREAALLGTPAYSIFAGPLGVIDQELIRLGRLTPIRSPEDVDLIPLRAKGSAAPTVIHSRLREFVVDQVADLATSKRSSGKGRQRGRTVR
jgi:hypothetical protein